MKLIYIAGPFTADTWWKVQQNIRRAEEWAKRIAEMGGMPVCPHTNTGNFWGLLTPEFWYEGTLKLMTVCDAVFFLRDYESSKGSMNEYHKAYELHIPRFFEVGFAYYCDKDTNLYKFIKHCK